MTRFLSILFIMAAYVGCADGLSKFARSYILDNSESAVTQSWQVATPITQPFSISADWFYNNF